MLLEGVDRRRLLEGEADIVEPVQEAVLAERVEVEGDAAAVGTADLLLLEVDRQRRVGAALGVVEELFEVFRRLTVIGRMPFLKQLL